MTIAGRLKEKNSFVPNTVISLESPLPANPVRLIVQSKENYEQNCANIGVPGKKIPKNQIKTLRAYSVEHLTPVPDESTQDFLVSLDNCNNLLGAIHLAATKRFPVVFTPEIIWYTILQGVSTHINLNPELASDVPTQLPEQNHYVKDMNEKLDWVSIIAGIGEMNKSKFTNNCSREQKRSASNLEPTGLLHPVLATNGSTNVSALSMKLCQGIDPKPQATPIASKSDFKRFVVGVQSSIPEVHVKGSSENYAEIIDKVRDMSDQFELQWWEGELVQVLEEFVKAARGQPDGHFWNYMFNLNGSSGFYMPYSGWIQSFYPYVDDGYGNLITNDFIGQWKPGYNEVMPPKVVKYPKKRFPSSLCKTSVHIHMPRPPSSDAQKAEPGSEEDVPEEIVRKLTLKSGLVAISQNKTNRAIQPVFGFTLTESFNPEMAKLTESSGEEIQEPSWLAVEKLKK